MTWAPEELEAVTDCPVCGSAARTTLYDSLEDVLCGTTGRWTMIRCLACGSGYLDPRPAPGAIGRAYERYFTHENAHDSSLPGRGLVQLKRAVRNGYLNAALGYRLRPAVPLARWLLAPFPIRRRQARLLLCDLSRPGRTGRLLDVGCGNGRLLAAMRWAGWLVEGVEPDERAAAHARSLGLTVHSGTLEDAGFPASSFDAITMTHVLEHLPDPVEALQRCRELLRPGGRLWLATPNLASPGHRRYGAGWLGLDPPRHLVLMTPSSLRWSLESAGFEVELLRPPSVAWMRARNEELRAAHLGRPLRLSRRLCVAIGSRLRDVRAFGDATLGEELVVLARPRQALRRQNDPDQSIEWSSSPIPCSARNSSTAARQPGKAPQSSTIT